MSTVREMIRLLSGVDDEEIYSLICTVKSVDAAGRICVCAPLNGDADLHGVMLQAVNSATTGVVLIPNINSFVIVTFLSKELAYVALTSEIKEIICVAESITFNDGTKGGLVVSSAVTAKLNTIIQDINALKSALANWVVAPSDGGAALKAIAANWYSATLSATQAADIENNKIKHG